MTTTALSSGWDSGFANIDLQSSPTTEAEVSTPSEISNAQLAQTPSDHEDDGDQGPDRRDVEANTDSNENREGSTGWVWARSRLRKLIKEAKGAASLTVVSFVGRHLKGTKVIFVVGQSGTGKTTILQELTGLDLATGDTMMSGTLQYRVCPAVIGDQQYLFVDTAGFGAADMDDMANFQDIVSCITALGSFVDIAGLLFVYGKPDTRIMRPDLQTMQWVQCFCGPEFFHKVTFITNRWDTYNEDSFEESWARVSELLRDKNVEQILDPPQRYHGGSLYHHGFPGGGSDIHTFASILSKRRHGPQRAAEIEALILRKYAESEPVKLQIARELEAGVALKDTEAAKVLQANPVDIKISISQDRATVKNESNARNNPSQFLDRPETASRQRNAESQEEQQPSWFARTWAWIEVAKQAAVYFNQVRRARDSTQRRSWFTFDNLRNWWSGSPPDRF